MIPLGLAPLVKQFESCKLSAYQDIRGIWTIGWGHTPALPGQVCTQAEADSWLSEDLETAWQETLKLIPNLVNCADGTQSALADFAYNLGAGNLEHSTLRTYALCGNWDLVKSELLKWDHAGSAITVAGLLRRREAEANLIEKDQSLGSTMQSRVQVGGNVAGVESENLGSKILSEISQLGSQLVQDTLPESQESFSPAGDELLPYPGSLDQSKPHTP